MSAIERYTREAERLVQQAHHFTYGDGADPVAGHALAAEAQVYATLALAAAQAVPVPGVVLEAAPTTVYRAEHPDSGIVLGLYTTPAAARAHCEASERRSWAKHQEPTFDWIEDDEDRVAEMTAWAHGEESTTGYVVTALDIDSEFDEEDDE
jgi:hypothetical protein